MSEVGSWLFWLRLHRVGLFKSWFRSSNKIHKNQAKIICSFEALCDFCDTFDWLSSRFSLTAV